MSSTDLRALRTRDGHTLHVHTLGRGPTVVLLHGFAMHGAQWIPLVAPLAGSFRFVLPDLRGFGRSHHVPFTKRDAVAQLADDVEDLLAQLGDDRVHVGGLSMGALTGLALAQRGALANARSYTHIDQAPRIHNGDDWRWGLFGDAQPARFDELRTLLDEATALRAVPFDHLPEHFSKRVRGAFGRFFQTAVRPAWMKRGAGLVAHPVVARRVLPLAHWGVYMDVLRAYLDERHDFRDALVNVRAPVTVMVGEASEMYPAEGQLALARTVAHARTVRFPRVGHAVPWEAPVGFVRALHGALRG